ncbi:hypothetical protein IJH16_03180 [Candidatus Saccharibacteria bacterium]|nr:hypothetical protein [Candidatus Saccharibacteria bacterium]
MSVNLQESPVGTSVIKLDGFAHFSDSNFDKEQLAIAVLRCENHWQDGRECLAFQERATFTLRCPENSDIRSVSELKSRMGRDFAKYLGCTRNDIPSSFYPELTGSTRMYREHEMFCWLDNVTDDHTYKLKALVIEFLCGEIELLPEVSLLKVPNSSVTEEYTLYFRPLLNRLFAISLTFSKTKPHVRLAGDTGKYFIAFPT